MMIFTLLALSVGYMKNIESYEVLNKDYQPIQSIRHDITKPSIAHQISNAPDIKIYPKIIDSELCYAIIESHQEILKDSTVKTGQQPVVSKSRKSQGALLKAELSDKILHIISENFNVNKNNIEPISVVHYKKDDFYNAHYDSFHEESVFAKEYWKGGERVRSVLIYLNTVPQQSGGSTFFPNIDMRFQPKQGYALSFKNYKKNNPNFTKTLHAAEQLEEGDKWILNIWIRERVFKEREPTKFGYLIARYIILPLKNLWSYIWPSKY